jgi:hypothetical protein
MAIELLNYVYHIDPTQPVRNTLCFFNLFFEEITSWEDSNLGVNITYRDTT